MLDSTYRIAATGFSVAAQFPTYRRGRPVDHAGDPSLTKALGLAELDGDAFFDAEFVIGHRGNTVPERSVLHSVFAAAVSYFENSTLGVSAL